MPIPKFNESGVLPPFIENDFGPALSHAMAPYHANISEVVLRFGTSSQRKELLQGFIEYRKSLSNIGVTSGYQWVDGSFIEDCEKCRSRPPNDIDVVTFAERPSHISNDQEWGTYIQSNLRVLSDRTFLKTQFHCDAFYEDLGLPGKTLVRRAAYWFGLFSHQRDSYLWKGMLVVPLQSDDDNALALLGGS